MKANKASVVNGNSEARSQLRIGTITLLIVLSVIWGLAFVAIKLAVLQLSPVNLTLLRWFIASPGYLLLLAFIGKPKVKFDRSDLPRLVAISAANVPAYHLALNAAEETVSSGLASLLVALGPVFIVVLSFVMLREKITPRVVIALFLAVAGATVLSYGNLGATGSIIGPLEVVISALATAVFSVLSKPLVAKYGALHVAIWAGVIGTGMLLPLLSASFVTQVSKLSLLGWGSVLYLSLLSTVLGYSVYYTLVSRGTLSRLSIQLYLIPIVSVVGGIYILRESLTAYTILGGAATLGAIAIVSTRAKRNTKTD